MSSESESSHINRNQLQRPPRYFYPAPPPPRPPPSRFRYSTDYLSPSTLSSVKGCFCCLFLVLIFISLLLITGVLVIAFIVKPKKPNFELQQVIISYFVVSTPSDAAIAGGSEAFLTLNITMNFIAENPNRVRIKYDPSNFTVFYRDVELATTYTQGAEEPARAARLLQVTVAVDRVNILPAYAHQLLRDAAIYGRIELNVIGHVGVHIHFLAVSSPCVQISLDCGLVVSPREQAVTEHHCEIH